MPNAATWHDIYDEIQLSGSYADQIAKADELIADITSFRDEIARTKSLSEELKFESLCTC